MQLAITALALCTIAGLAGAQTQTLRGKVEDVRGTQNQFFLDCTSIPLVSTALNLNAWIGQQAVLQVVNVGTTAAPVLRVDAATATTKVFDMGNLRQGQTARWQVNAPAGSFVLIAVDYTSLTGYAPLGGLGTLLLSAGAGVIASGFTNAQHQFEISFFVPTIPGLVGTSFTGQALVGDHGTWFLSNPDCKTFE